MTDTVKKTKEEIIQGKIERIGENLNANLAQLRDNHKRLHQYHSELQVLQTLENHLDRLKMKLVCLPDDSQVKALMEQEAQNHLKHLFPKKHRVVTRQMALVRIDEYTHRLAVKKAALQAHQHKTHEYERVLQESAHVNRQIQHLLKQKLALVVKKAKAAEKKAQAKKKGE